MRSFEKVLNLADLAAIAAKVIEPTAWDYYRSGAWDEHTLARSEAAWRELEIHYRGMVDVSTRSARTTLFGREVAGPLLAAPTAMQKMAHPDGECATARACAQTGLPMCLSSLSTTALEDVRAATNGPLWMQIYISQDRGFTKGLVERADAAGIEAFAVTADTPVWGIRERDMRNGFRVPDGMRIVNLERPGGPTGHSGVGIGGALSWTIDATLTWKDVEKLASWTKRPILVKGLCRPDDVRAALDAGAKGVWISNHGGRQLDGAPRENATFAAQIGAPCRLCNLSREDLADVNRVRVQRLYQPAHAACELRAIPSDRCVFGIFNLIFQPQSCGTDLGDFSRQIRCCLTGSGNALFGSLGNERHLLFDGARQSSL